MNSQDFIMKLITARFAEDTSPVLIDDRQYGNTGTLRTLHPVTYEQVAVARYDFQNERVIFKVDAGTIAAHWYGEARRPGQASWVCSSIPELVDRVTKHLEGK